ncbi:MAG: hypothetical protein H7125_12145 [Proteobacteria bacterium]|nr:hypothetical protein [Burkholderiales bacterium]
MDKPLGNEDLSEIPGERVIDKPELPGSGITNGNDVYTEFVVGEMQLKRGSVEKFEVFSDEGERIGGTNRYPSPMNYLAMAIGF